MTVLNLPELVCHAQATVCAQNIVLAVRDSQGESIVVDASALNKFDSSVVAVLLECRRETLAAGKHFEVSGLPLQLRELTKLYGVHSLLQ